MCNKRNSVSGLAFEIGKKPTHPRLDSCMRNLIISLCSHGYNTKACCCGHGRYPMTIVCATDKTGRNYELISGKDINRKKMFYKKDSEGYYYIPEVSGNSSHN